MGLLGIAIVNGFVSLASLLEPLFLLLFPLLIEGLLVVGEEGVDLLIGVLLDGAAGLAVCAAKVGRAPRVRGCGRSDGVPTREAIHGDVAVDKDHLKLKDLILIEVELFFQHFQLSDGAFGSRVFRAAGCLGGGIGIGCLRIYQGRKGQGEKEEQGESRHL